MEKNQIAVTATSMKVQPLSSTNSWAISKTEVAIYNSNLGKKIKDFKTTEELAPLIEVIGYWRKMLGIKDNLTKDELISEQKFNATFIYEEFPEYSIERIKMAIKASLKGIINVDSKTWNGFSPIYIASILTAYDKYDKSVMSDILKRRQQQKMKKLNEPSVPSPDEKIESRRIFIQHFIDNVNVDQVIPFYDKNDCVWNFLIKNELLTVQVLDRIDLKKLAKEEAIKGKSPFEAAMMNEMDDDKKIKHFAMKEFFSASEFRLSDYTDKQVMI